MKLLPLKRVENLEPAIVALSPAGAMTARRIAAALGKTSLHGARSRVQKVDVLFDAPAEHLRALYLSRTPIIAICAAGIVIRALAPVLGDKWTEPPVIAVSQDGAHVVPLLGGHRDANTIAERVAAALGGVAASTTASDRVFGLALDAPPPGWRLADPAHAKSVMARLLAGETCQIDVAPGLDADWLQGAHLPEAAEAPIRLVAGWGSRAAAPGTLRYRPTDHVLGLGAARGCAPEELAELARIVLQTAGVAQECIACLASLDLKSDEPALIALSETLGVPLRLFTACELEAETPRLHNPSQAVFTEVGCHGVAEAAALAGVGVEGQLIVAKRKSANATAALACAPAPLDAMRIGRARGRLSVIGIGPGAAAWRTPEASLRLGEAEEIVGYGLYLDLVADITAGKPKHAFPLGAEEARARFALTRAADGRRVALISSGDAGIYGMASLVFELIAQAAHSEGRVSRDGALPVAAARVEVEVLPGISALQAAAARVGAPLGHDFAAISLSDLLTPWETIQARLEAVARSDFVVALYNPVSRRRTRQFETAQGILRAHRPPETPVAIAANLGRSAENVRVMRLDEIKTTDIDMLTVVIVGASQSRVVDRGAGLTPWMFTPRGYLPGGGKVENIRRTMDKDDA